MMLVRCKATNGTEFAGHLYGQDSDDLFIIIWSCFCTCEKEIYLQEGFSICIRPGLEGVDRGNPVVEVHQDGRHGLPLGVHQHQLRPSVLRTVANVQRRGWENLLFPFPLPHHLSDHLGHLHHLIVRIENIGQVIRSKSDHWSSYHLVFTILIHHLSFKRIVLFNISN